jgi:hypothetical protein
MGVSGNISNQMAGSEDSYSNRNGSFNWDKKSEYPYDSYYEATDKIKRLKREGRHDEVEDLLMWCINFAEAEAETKNQTLPRAYYRHLAIVYRKENRYHDEVKILERYILFCEKLGDQPREEITGRLDRAKELAAK